KDPVGQKKHVHGPAAAGACESCHSSHTAKFPKLLPAEGRDLCFSCHTDMKRQMGQVKFKHEAVEKDCADCHDAHASDYTMQVKQPPLELCTSCHAAEKKAATEAKVKHS